MYDFVIVHGSYGSPFENWFKWLYEKLTEEGKNVLVPQFPSGLNIQTYENWEKVLNSYRHLINEKTVFIGHSLAPAFIVDYLIKNNLKADRLFLVAPFYDLINIPDFDAVNSPFFLDLDLTKIKELCKTIYCFISTTDPYVPNELSYNFSETIGAERVVVENAGHFNTAAGYQKFDLLLNYIKKSI